MWITSSLCPKGEPMNYQTCNFYAVSTTRKRALSIPIPSCTLDRHPAPTSDSRGAKSLRKGPSGPIGSNEWRSELVHGQPSIRNDSVLSNQVFPDLVFLCLQINGADWLHRAATASTSCQFSRARPSPETDRKAKQRQRTHHADHQR